MARARPPKTPRRSKKAPALAVPTERNKKSGYQRAKEKGTEIVVVRLPLGYLRILETEARLVRSRRGQFLEQLLLRKRGELQLERTATAPEHELSDEELRVSKMWAWYLDQPMRKLMDADRFQMGNFTVGAWIIT